MQQAPNRLSKQAMRSETTRSKVCAAAVTCLDRLGYGDTTLTRVQDHAGVSRGALMHQFSTKEDMIVETLARILAPTRPNPTPAPAPTGAKARGVSMQADLLGLWSHMVNSAEARALVEILVAARTDTALATKVEPLLAAYDDEINREIVNLYKATSGDPADVVQLWTICRVFMRSLHIQKRFSASEDDTQAIVLRFAELIAPHLQPLDRNADPAAPALQETGQEKAARN